MEGALREYSDASAARRATSITPFCCRLHYNYYRDYDPVTARYVESDPIGLDGGFNTYLYANANSVSHWDPLGLFDFRNLFPKHSPALRQGEAIAAMAAYVVGKATGDELLCEVAADDLEAKRTDNIEAFAFFLGSRGDRADVNRMSSRTRGIPDSYLGPSGLPKRHTVGHTGRKSAREAAERDVPLGGRVRHDANPTDPRQRAHYQAEDAGNNVRPVVHHEYPR